MPTHKVRVYIEPPKGNARSAITNWIKNGSGITSSPVALGTTELRHITKDGSGETYLRGDWRFKNQGETPGEVLTDLSNRLQKFQNGLWHRVGYAVQSGKKTDGAAWEWHETIEWAKDGEPIPAGVPTFDIV